MIFFYNQLTRNLEIGNIPIWVAPSICWLGQVRDTNLAQIISNKMLVNNAKCQGYSFPSLREDQQGGKGGGVKLTPATQIRV